MLIGIKIINLGIKLMLIIQFLNWKNFKYVFAVLKTKCLNFEKTNKY